MNKILKAGATVAASILVLTGAAGMAACDRSNEVTGGTAYDSTIAKNVYILYKGTLHKGDILGFYGNSAYGNASQGFGISGYQLDCKNENGENKIIYGYDIAEATNFEPDSTQVAHRCKECFER